MDKQRFLSNSKLTVMIRYLQKLIDIGIYKFNLNNYYNFSRPGQT